MHAMNRDFYLLQLNIDVRLHKYPEKNVSRISVDTSHFFILKHLVSEVYIYIIYFYKLLNTRL